MRKRLDLRAFQQQVLDRLNAPEGSRPRVTTLGIAAGDSLWLVDMADLSEVLPLPRLTEVPLTRHWYCGVANVRGNLYGVIDLAAYWGQPQTAREPGCRVLLLAQKFGVNAGLLVSRVLGLRNTASWQTETSEGQALLRDGSGQHWRRLDLAALVKQPEFMQIGL